MPKKQQRPCNQAWHHVMAFGVTNIGVVLEQYPQHFEESRF